MIHRPLSGVVLHIPQAPPFGFLLGALQSPSCLTLTYHQKKLSIFLYRHPNGLNFSMKYWYNVRWSFPVLSAKYRIQPRKVFF